MKRQTRRTARQRKKFRIRKQKKLTAKKLLIKELLKRRFNYVPCDQSVCVIDWSDQRAEECICKLTELKHNRILFRQFTERS